MENSIPINMNLQPFQKLVTHPNTYYEKYVKNPIKPEHLHDFSKLQLIGIANENGYIRNSDTKRTQNRVLDHSK